MAIPLNMALGKPQGIVIDETRYLPSLVCELIARYEEVLHRTKPPGAELVRRKVVETSKFNSRLIPVCPSPEDHELLPEEDIDCVSYVLDYDASFWTTSCYTLRITANPGLISVYVYLGTTPKLGGIIPLQIRNIIYLVFALMSANSGSSHHPTAPDDKVRQEALAIAGQIGHIIESALQEATTPLIELSAHDRLTANRGRRAEALTPQQNAIPEPIVTNVPAVEEPRQGADAPSPPIRKAVKRREEEQ
jgi:hypothetical protein